MFSQIYIQKHLLQLFLNTKKYRYNKNVLIHSVQLYLNRTINIILLLFCKDFKKTYLFQALQCPQEKYSSLALGMWNGISVKSQISVDLLELFVHAFIQHTNLQQTQFEAAAAHLIVRTNIRPNIKVKFKGSLPVWQEKAWILELSFLSSAWLKHKNLTITQKRNS